MVECVPKNTNVSMFIPEAELAQSGLTVVLNDNQSLVQGNVAPSPIPNSSGGGIAPPPSGDVIVSGDTSGRHTYNRLMYTKLF